MVMIKGVRRPGEGLEEPEQCQQGGWKGMEQLDGAPQEAKQGRHTCRETAGWGGEKPGWEEEVDHPRPARWAAAPSGHFLPLPGPTRPSSPNQCHLVGPKSVYSPDDVEEGLSRSFSDCGGKPLFPSTSAGVEAGLYFCTL